MPTAGGAEQTRGGNFRLFWFQTGKVGIDLLSGARLAA